MGSCAAPSAKGDDKFITTDYLQQCRDSRSRGVSPRKRAAGPLTSVYEKTDRSATHSDEEE
ncbi:hypothetical protein EQ817_23145 [Escherichia coli]|nr:hypothetical protein EQ817_23145 [Escherichia coli]